MSSEAIQAWEDIGENYSPTDHNVEPKSFTEVIIDDRRWMTYPDDPTVLFPEKAFAPKILTELETGAQPALCNIETESRRDLYKSLKLEELLFVRGVRAADVMSKNALPLEIFENDEYDCRTPEEWLNLGDVEGARYPLPAEALLQAKKFQIEGLECGEPFQSLLSCQPVAVINYDPATRLWDLFTLDGERQTYQLPRLYVRFYAEDSRVFADRLAAAVIERNKAEASIKYYWYLDCMPSEGIDSLSNSQREEIARLAARKAELRTSLENRIAILEEEALRNYQRVMCDLECRCLLPNYSDVSDFLDPNAASQLEDHCSKRLVEMPKSSHFQEIQEYAQWNSLYVQSEVYEAMLSIIEECYKASSMVLFPLKYTKSLTIDEFEAQMLHMTHSVVSYLQERWVESVSQTIRMCLRDVGKGWFDLTQRHCDIYDIMKLKRFMELIKQRMQSALRVLIESSSMLYLNALETPAVPILNVKSDFTWDSDLKTSPFELMASPIFELEINMNQETPYYATNPKIFQEKIDFLYCNALQLCQLIKQIHPLLLINLKFAKNLYINSVDMQEPLICEIRDRLSIAYEKSIIPLLAYIKKYEVYQELYNINVAEYVTNYENGDHSLIELKEEIQMHLTEKENMEKDVPHNIYIGAFNIKVDKLKKHLVEKRQELANRLLDMHTNRLRNQVEEILEEFKIIFRKLLEEPENIEQVFELREWMEGVPVIIGDHYENLQKLKIEYDMLDVFNWNLSDEDFQSKWEALHFTLRIQLQIKETLSNLAFLEKETFLKAHMEDESNIADKIDSLIGSVTNIALQNDIKKVHEVAKDVRRTIEMMKETQEFGLVLNSRQKLFGKPVKPFDKLAKLIKDFESYKSFWLTASDWLKWYEIWMDNPLIKVEGGPIESMVTEMYKTISRCIKIFQDNPDIHAMAIDLKYQMEFFKPYVGVITALRNPGMKARHLKELSDRIGIEITMTPDLTFKNLLSLDIMRFEEEIKEISESAAKEHAIEDSLSKMQAEWENLELEIVPHKDTGTYIMKIADEIQLLLDDHILQTQQISFSPFKAAFEEEVDTWQNSIKLTQEVIYAWLDVQKIWMYLEPIFSSEDISRQLPVEAKKYNTMERNWRRIMKQAYDNPIIIKVCPDRTLLESLRECMNLLEIVQKGLADYLESRRMIFPRFFFLSDDELLEILAQAKNVKAVQPHLKKCFENMKELRFEEDLLITRMYSSDGEEVIFETPVYPEGSVECWLGTVEAAMRNTLRSIIGEALKSVEKLSRKDWVFRWPGQVSLAGGQTSWTAHVAQAISDSNLDGYLKVMISQLDDLRHLVRGQRTEIERLMLEAIITIEVHARDVLLKLIEHNVTSVNDFDWISQLRYYWVDDTDLKVRAVNAEFQYGYEYLGNNGRLVITPLTDRCYLTLTGALHLKFGGAPAGPAGTGKTETTKDLAKALAIQCVVFNCSDQLDYMSMGKFFKGLASSGAWACFDEFNRIDIEVLSVIAQQVMTIHKAQQLNADRFVFEGVEMDLKASCASFITMNPGYAGRTELPDNLKALYRPVAMMVPDYTLIAEISLFSCGFSNAKALAAKITATFKLSSEQLSSQDHYDFGMRSVKTVIAVAGILKREQKDMAEDQICLRALRDVNVPKFLRDDLILFNGIVSDLFPGVKEKSIDYEQLIEAIKKSIHEMGLAPVEAFIHKVIQLYETTIVRHGLMLVGPTGSGKTKCYLVLQAAINRLKGRDQPSGKPFTPVHTYVLNPKSITMGQLYGEYDLDTHEWTDGILSTLIRAGTTATDNDKRWYVFDGPVDAVWIENMNTVLDDNKKLCLSSGEIMRLTPCQTMMFEVEDLRVASPATVSRCGMVYLEPSGLGINPFIDCWIKKLPKHLSEYAEEMSKLAYFFIIPGLKFLRDHLREIVTSVDSGLVIAYTNLMNYQIGTIKVQDGVDFPAYLIEPWSAFAFIWSIGATCDGISRYIFSDWMRELQSKADHQMQFPPEGLVYDYKLCLAEDAPQDGEEEPQTHWQKWLDDGPPMLINAETKFSDIEVPTIDMVRSAALMHYLLTTERNILCIGPTGSGKTLTVSTKLSREMPKKYICDFIIFSARTSANQTQDLIDSKLDKRRRGVYGPPISKKQIFFIDDLNMPALETYGAQPPIELLRQFIDLGGWYDRKEIGDYRAIEDVNIVGAMAPPGGGRNPVTPRLLRHFHYIAFPDMDDDTKRIIFGTILFSWLSRTSSLEDLLEPLVTATIRIFSTICKELLPTPDKSHYTFNVRDLGKVFQGILMAEPKQMLQIDDLFILWYHENYRVYSDRLTCDADREWFKNLLQHTLQREFNYDISGSLEQGTLFYADFCNPEGRYERIRDTKKIQKVLTDLLYDYNNSTTVPMNLVLFEDAMGHICRITRILRQSPGNALLLGMGGSGRQSLTKLSSHIAEYTCFQIELSQTYSIRDWRDDLKELLLTTGLQNKSMVFLFTDSQIKSTSFLEDINNILNSGDVPNIYQADEMDKIFQAMRGIVQEAGLQLNRSNLLSAFQKVIRNNLHTVLAMCPIGELFRARIRQFPALVSLCTIDWFDPWPDSALQSVAMHFLQDVKDAAITDNVLKSIVKTCQFMHSSVIKASEDFLQELNRHNYVTPTCYLELISSYGDLLEKKRNEFNNGIARLSTGLKRLATTEVEVKEMQILLEKMKPDLERAAEVAAEMIVQIGKDTEIAEVARVKAAEQEKQAIKLKKENEAIRDEAEADLSTARPMLEAAEASLKALNKGDITEVKAMKRPPVGVVLVIEAICIIKKVKPLKVAGERVGEKLNDYWTPGSQMLADAGQFLSSLENYNKEEINEDMIKQLKTYIENPSFAPKKVQKVSKACHSLCLWVHAMYNWYFVNLRVAPKMAALQQAQEELQRTEEQLEAAKEKLREVEAGLDRLQMKFRKEEEKKAELERQKQLCEERMSRAVRLISGLAGEQKRWIATVADIKVALTKLIGDILLSAGAIAYLTPFIDTYRNRLLSAWYELLGEGVPHTEGCSPVSVLGDPVEIRRWQIDGLPRDALSVENAVLVMNSKRWPLFIDPQGQANRWIRNVGQSSGGLSTARMTDKDLLRVVESCVRFGRTCLIENVGLELEAALDTVLMRSLFRQAGVLSIKIGDNIVPYSFDFRLYLTTKLPNPHYPPEIAVKVLLVNFMLTASGLTDQMLSLVVMQERAELEETRSALVVSMAQMKRELKDIEDRILYRLSLSEGSAVDDIDLILTLEASKVKSEEIKIKVESAELTQIDIDAARSLYIPVAERAQILFFCLLDLQQVDTMYQYSLEWFIRIFVNSMIMAEKNENIDERVINVNEFFTFSLFSNVCRSLFEKHKLHFAFLLCIRIQMRDDLIDGQEWRFLLSGAIPPKEESNPAPDWLPHRCWTEIQSLQVLSKFQSFVSSFKSLIYEFKKIFDALEPEKAKYPGPWDSKLNDFQKMLVLKCLRPDKVINAMQLYIGKFLGNRFIEPQTSGLDAIYKESSPTTPLIFVLSSGTDPASELYKFAEKLKMARKLFSISLGQGQGPKAELMLRQSIEVGNWLFYQNCHLAPSWMPKLEILVETLPPDVTHRDFRLWLTSMPSNAFPVSILQNGSKMTIEPPRGVKANALRAYSTQVIELKEVFETEDETIIPKIEILKGLIFSLCLFHGILLERRKFGPLGFNIPYEFTDGDFTICMSQLHMFLMEYAEIPFKVLIYTAGHINYGGRITDDWDRRCVLTILENFYNEQVLTPGYQFDDHGYYRQPPFETTFNEYIDLVKSLPINDDPSLFGLHTNADISYAQAETYACLATLLALQPREIGGAAKGTEDLTSKLAKSILDSLPAPFDLAAIQEKYPVLYEESLNTVLVQEAARYNGLLIEMSSSLKDLLKALKGLVVMSEKLESMAAYMFSNKVPENWQAKAFSSLKPLGSWVEDLKERIRFINSWQKLGIPSAFWISGFYFPQAFLTGTLQNYARKHGISIDSIDFGFKVLPDKPLKRPIDGCAVYGLFLEGCRWDGITLTESYPKELFTEMKPILLLPEVNRKKIESGIYVCPVYKTVVRAGTLSTTGHSTNFVLAMEIPSDKPRAHWIIRGPQRVKTRKGGIGDLQCVSAKPERHPSVYSPGTKTYLAFH